MAHIDWRFPFAPRDEVLERLRAVRPGLPPVVMSGVDDREPELRPNDGFPAEAVRAPRRLLDVLRALLTSSGGQTR